MNEMHEIVEKENMNWSMVRSLFLLDKRINESHTQVPGKNHEYGFGGSCFPKDLKALISEYVNLKLLPQVERANTKFKEKNNG